MVAASSAVHVRHLHLWRDETILPPPESRRLARARNLLLNAKRIKSHACRARAQENEWTDERERERASERERMMMRENETHTHTWKIHLKKKRKINKSLMLNRYITLFTRNVLLGLSESRVGRATDGQRRMIGRRDSRLLSRRERGRETISPRHGEDPLAL